MRLKLNGLIILLCIILISVVAVGVVQAEIGARVSIEDIDTELFPNMEAYISVSDANGFPLHGLDISNFNISEDGSPVNNFEIGSVQNVKQQLSIVLVLDTSGSMSWDGPPSRIDNTLHAARDFLETLLPQDQVALVTFSTEAKVVQGLTSDKNLIENALDTVTAIGDTAMYDGVMDAINILKDEKTRRIIVLLTDGVDTSSVENTSTTIIDQAKIYNIPIFTIGFGGVDSVELNKIANETGGNPYVNQYSTTIKSNFQSILQVLREQYLIRYVSAIPADTLEHELTVELNYLEEVVSDTEKFVAESAEIEITMPGYVDGDSIGGKIDLVPTIVGPAAIYSLEIYINDSLLETVTGDDPHFIWDAKTLSNGINNFKFVVQDIAGNTGEFSIDLDVQPAILLSILSPSDGDALSVTTPIISEISSQRDLSKVEIFVGDELITEMINSPYEFSWEVQDFPRGNHIIKIVAHDLAGNFVENEITVEVRDPIEIEFLSTKEGDKISGQEEIVLDIDSHFDIVSVRVSINGEELKTFNNEPYSIIWKLFDVKNGDYIISAVADDVLGHQTSAEIKVVVAQIICIDCTDGSGALIVFVPIAIILAIVIPIGLRKRKEARLGSGDNFAGNSVLFEVNGKNQNKIWPLSTGEIRLGRKSDNDIPLLGLKASRQMAIIQFHNDGHIIFSLNPENPVVVNNMPIAQEHPLLPGDIIILGDSEFRYEIR